MTSLEEKRLINRNSLKILNDPKGQWMVSNFLFKLSLQKIHQQPMGPTLQIHCRDRCQITLALIQHAAHHSQRNLQRQISLPY